MINALHETLWSYILPCMVLGLGLRLFVVLRFKPYSWLISALKSMRHRSEAQGISPFQTLATVLSGTVGTGTIAGVAMAIKIGGPGVLFYMWIVAILGMIIKYCESLLAIGHRRTDSESKYFGGVMYYIDGVWGSESLLSKAFSKTYAIACMLSALGIGASVQSHSIAHTLNTSLDIPCYVTGLFLMLCASLVVLGGVKRIALVAEFIVPFMIIIYLSMCLWVMFAIRYSIPSILSMIYTSAIYGYDNSSLWAGTSIAIIIQQGVARGIFTNEAGLGSSAFAQAASVTDEPRSQSAISMLSTFVDTMLVCTLTGIVILSGEINMNSNGAHITIAAIKNHIENAHYIISVCMLLFGFTTMLTWCYYGKICAGYLNPKWVKFFFMTWLIAILYGSVLDGQLVWIYADLANALMMIPNLITLSASTNILYTWMNNGHQLRSRS